MPETESGFERLNEGLSRVDRQALEQYPTSLWPAARFALYKYAAGDIGYIEAAGTSCGIRGEIYNALELRPGDSIVDIGCGKGDFIQLLHDLGHTGIMTGVNFPKELFIPTEEVLKHASRVNFIEANAYNLPLRTDSQDKVTVQFLVYHVDDSEKALSEAARILKPDGKLVVATRNVGNQRRLWGLQQVIKKELERAPSEGEQKTQYSGLAVPQSFYVHCDMVKTREILIRLGLEIVDTSFHQQDELRIPEEDWDSYVLALTSIYTEFDPQPRGGDVVRAIDSVIKPLFLAEVKRRGYFVDYVDQGFFVCKKVQTSSI